MSTVNAADPTAEPRAILLQGNGVTVQFGGLTAVDHIDFQIYRGEILGLIGPNGAGKTTLFNTITGQVTPTAGSLVLNGNVALERLSPNQVTGVGIARTFQNIRIFKRMSVLENVLVGAHWLYKSNSLSVMFGTRSSRREEARRVAEVRELLDLLGLGPFEREMAQNLSYGVQRRLEIARALAAKPALLMIDEPTAGMNSQETEELAEFVERIRYIFNLTVFLIEHDMKFVMSLSERIMVLNTGQKIAEGTPAEIQRNPAVIEAYLGKEGDDA